MAKGLTDMEEHLQAISDSVLREFMREALTCYGAGAYRACIVMAFIAVFEDLRQKVKAAASLNKDAKAISKAVETLAEGQKPFETDLVNQLNGKNLLSALQAKRLTQMIDHRNKAAHPSGHYASAEEARFVFFEAIDSYLSKPLLSAENFARAVLERLHGENYFPDTTMENIRNAVAEELEQLNPAAYPFLVAQLVAGITEGPPDYQTNSRMFLTGLAGLKHPEIRPLLATQLIKAKAISKAFRDAIASSISADPLVLKALDGVTQTRVNTLLIGLTKNTFALVAVTKTRHPLRVLRSMVRDLEESEVLPAYEGFVRATVERYATNAELTRVMDMPGVRAEVMAHYLKQAGSSDFGSANKIAKALPDLDAGLGKALSPRDALELLIVVHRAADLGAWNAQALAEAKFAATPELRALAVSAIDKGGAKTIALLTKHGLTPGGVKDDWLTDNT